ncbi:MAG: chromophore lyase CpcT/CpeT [Pseudomonadota bacterium]
MKALCLLTSTVALLASYSWADTPLDFAQDAEGSWTTVEQSSDPAYDWVESEMRRIWPDRNDGVWLYQENAIIGSNTDNVLDGDPKSQPYFQVVVNVRDLGDGELHTTTYRVSDRAAARGAYATGSFEDTWLGEIACMGHMRRIGVGFWSGDAVCPNSYKGGVKVVSRSVRSPNTYVNWDRGFDVDGNHIWGPAEGGYIFKRKSGEQK